MGMVMSKIIKLRKIQRYEGLDLFLVGVMGLFAGMAIQAWLQKF